MLCFCVQIARLRSELDVVRGNIKVMSEMLTEMVPGQEEASDLELLQVCEFTLTPLQRIDALVMVYYISTWALNWFKEQNQNNGNKRKRIKSNDYPI